MTGYLDWGKNEDMYQWTLKLWKGKSNWEFPKSKNFLMNQQMCRQKKSPETE